MKIFDIINVECCVFVNNYFNMDSFSIFTENLKLASAAHSYHARSARNDLLFVPSYKSVRFGQKINDLFIHSTIVTWNHLQNQVTENYS